MEGRKARRLLRRLRRVWAGYFRGRLSCLELERLAVGAVVEYKGGRRWLSRASPEEIRQTRREVVRAISDVINK